MMNEKRIVELAQEVLVAHMALIEANKESRRIRELSINAAERCQDCESRLEDFKRQLINELGGRELDADLLAEGF